MVALPSRRSDDAGVARWEPLNELHRLSSQFQRSLDDLRGLPSILDDAFAPLADVEETDDAFVVEIDLAGVNKDDVVIELAGRRLVVTGERKERERVGILRKRTRTVGAFRYEVVLPSELDEDDVRAELDQGVLTVRVPKAVGERPRRIAVQ